MTTRLQRYNEALRLLGLRKLSALTDNVEPRKVLDDIWDDGAIDACLEQGYWNFATRVVQISYNPSIIPSFGYQYAFDKPTDLIRVSSFCSDEYFRNPLREYVDESGYWFSDLTEVFVKYISNDSAYGSDTSLWSPSFAKFFSAYLALEAVDRLTSSTVDYQKLEMKLDNRLRDARAKDASNQPTLMPRQGSWVRARGGRVRDRTGNIDNA